MRLPRSRELAEVYLLLDRLMDRIKPGAVLTKRDYRELSDLVEQWKALTPIDLPERRLPSEAKEPATEDEAS